MFANSRPVFSGQSGPHPDLSELVTRHAHHPFLKPVGAASQEAYQAFRAAWDGQQPLILDAGCGVGWSTIHLARAWPEHFVLGVDRSSDRLEREKTIPGELPANARLLRADLVDFWRLLAADGIRLARHYLLYPNPWPKIGHLSRRWHGHPVFPTLLALGGQLECRSNWPIYVQELALAVAQLTGKTMDCGAFVPATPLTPFERKYQESGHTLWRAEVALG